MSIIVSKFTNVHVVPCTVATLTNHAKCTGTVLEQLSAQSNVAAFLMAQSNAPTKPAVAAKPARAREVKLEL